MLINPFREKRNWPLLPILLCVFLALYVRYGVVYANDSYTYIAGSVRVSPLYPALILLFKMLFPTNASLQALVIFQEMLTAYAIFSLMTFVRTRFSVPVLFWYVLCLGFAGTYVLRLIMAGETALYCNTILTEAICYPLYFIFIKYAFAAWDHKDVRHFTMAFLLAFLLACTRGQLAFLLLVLIAVFFRLLSGQDKRTRRAISFRALLCAVCYTLGFLFFPAAYNAALSGTTAQTTMGNEVILGALLYNSDSTDAALFPAGSEEQTIIAETLALGEAEDLTHASAPHGFLGAFEHYQASFDPLRGKLMTVVSQRYASELLDDNTKRVVISELASAVIPTLLKANFGTYLGTAAINCLGGLVRSNSILNVPGTLFSALVYLFSAVVYALARKNNKLQSERRFLLLITISTLANAVFCSFGVFELSRYVYYNFPFLYLSAALLAFGLIRSHIKRAHSLVGHAHEA